MANRSDESRMRAEALFKKREQQTKESEKVWAVPSRAEIRILSPDHNPYPLERRRRVTHSLARTGIVTSSKNRRFYAPFASPKWLNLHEWLSWEGQ